MAMAEPGAARARAHGWGRTARRSSSPATTMRRSSGGVGPGPGPGAPIVGTPSPRRRLRRLTTWWSWLSPARTRVSYPGGGGWGDRIWATHGHYLDHHLSPGRARRSGILRRGPPRREDAIATTALRLRAPCTQIGRRSREALAGRGSPRAARRDAGAGRRRGERVHVVPGRELMLSSGPGTGDRQAPGHADAPGRGPRDGPGGGRGWASTRTGCCSVTFTAAGRSAGRYGPRAGQRLGQYGAWLYERLLLDRVAAAPIPIGPAGRCCCEGRTGPPRTLGLLRRGTQGAEQSQAAFSGGGGSGESDGCRRTRATDSCGSSAAGRTAPERVAGEGGEHLEM